MTHLNTAHKRKKRSWLYRSAAYCVIIHKVYIKLRWLISFYDVSQGLVAASILALPIPKIMDFQHGVRTRHPHRLELFFFVVLLFMKVNILMFIVQTIKNVEFRQMSELLIMH